MFKIIARAILSLLPIIGVVFHQSQIKKLNQAHRRELRNENSDWWSLGYESGLEEGKLRAERDALYKKSGLL